jgi:signal peptidase complex subunit 2
VSFTAELDTLASWLTDSHHHHRLQIITERITLSSSTTPVSKSSSSPSYSVALHYVRSTNGGKTLLGRGRTKGAAPYTKFFDDKGVMNQEAFEKWVGGLVETSMDGKAA